MSPRASLLLVDDDDAFRLVMGEELERLGFAVLTACSGNQALGQMEEHQPDVVLLDLQLPDKNGLEVLKEAGKKSPESEVIMLTGHGTIDTAIEAIREGAFDYISKPCPLDELEVRIRRALERQALRRRTSVLERGLTPADPGEWLVGESPKFRALVELAHRVAPTDSTVLITGETGSGKEMVAKLLHTRSPRREKPFVVVECAALQEDLLQSELFGHERGAFTGADRGKAGLFEVANGGTIFLDEIGEVSPATQVKLLRVLDASTFRHVGGTAEIRVDVRILAATNRDLPAMVRQGLFREDLYYRLSTIILTLPPLRERGGDVDLLANYFVTLLNARHGQKRRLAPETLAALRLHDWPGNVRELLHAMERALVVADGEEVRPGDLPRAIRSGPDPASDTSSPGALPSLEELERAHVERVLRAVDGHRSSAARILGISERNLYRKLKSYKLS
ncbi:MAG: sigma-54-dependent transcriptional regulator [Longimicrobiales bacterium]